MAAFDFPPNASHPAAPTLGEKWPQPAIAGKPVYTWDGEKWTTIGGEIGSIGGADDPPLMDGTATVGISLQWAREDHVHPTDTGIAMKVSKAGDTMTGPLLLPTTTAGSAATSATTKNYVDSVAAPVPSFPAGTVMVFYNAAAPTGWTKITAGSDNRALRVVSGSGGTGGGVQNFSTVFGRTGTDNFTLSTNEMPNHQHNVSFSAFSILDFNQAGSWDFVSGSQLKNLSSNYLTGAAGSSATHSHTIDLRVLYLDVILCSKN